MLDVRVSLEPCSRQTLLKTICISTDLLFGGLAYIGIRSIRKATGLCLIILFFALSSLAVICCENRRVSILRSFLQGNTYSLKNTCLTVYRCAIILSSSYNWRYGHFLLLVKLIIQKRKGKWNEFFLYVSSGSATWSAITPWADWISWAVMMTMCMRGRQTCMMCCWSRSATATADVAWWIIAVPDNGKRTCRTAWELQIAIHDFGLSELSRSVCCSRLTC